MAGDVAPTQIPQFLPQLTLDKLNSETALLRALTNAVLDEAASLFKVRRQWLNGVDAQTYNCAFSYKAPERFFESLADIQFQRNAIPVRALYTLPRLDAAIDREQPLAIFLVEKVRDIGDNEICRYVIFNDQWDWSHPPCRIQLKAMVRLIDRVLGEIVPLYHVEPSVLEACRQGRLIPRACMERPPLTNPSLEDFALARKESAVAKECEELPAVQEYITKHNLTSLALGLKKKMQ